MRKPTTREEAYRWWNATTRGEPHPHIAEDEIQAGYFKRRKWMRGPWIPARIWLEPGEIDPLTGELLTDEIWRAEIDGKPAPVEWVWRKAWPIALDEWMWLTAQSPLLPKRAPPPKPGPFARR